MTHATRPPVGRVLRRIVQLGAAFALLWLGQHVNTTQRARTNHKSRGASKLQQRVWPGITALVSIPDDPWQPFQLLHLEDSGEDSNALRNVTLEVHLRGGHTYRPTHLLSHPYKDHIIYATSESRDGQLLTLYFRSEDPVELSERGAIASGGSDPAHAAFTSDGLQCICANYASAPASISAHTLIAGDLLSKGRTLTLPASDSDVESAVVQHPHQIIMHPVVQDLAFILILGQDAIYQFNTSLDSDELPRLIWQSSPTVGRNLRHGIFGPAGDVLFVVFETSSTIAAIPLDDHGMLLPRILNYSSTLPPSQQQETGGGQQCALSDIKLSRDGHRAFVLNRQIQGPFADLQEDELGGDTLAVFDVREPSEMRLLKHVDLGCWQPREMVVAASDTSSDTIWITCVGWGGKGGGVRVVAVDSQGYGRVIASWRSVAGAWGIVGLTMA